MGKTAPAVGGESNPGLRYVGCIRNHGAGAPKHLHKGADGTEGKLLCC